MDTAGIKKEMFGTDQNIILDTTNQTISFSDLIPDNVYTIDSKEFLLNLKIHQINDLPLLPPKNHLKAFQGLLPYGKYKHLPWALCLPEGAFKQFLEAYLDDLLDVIKKIPDPKNYLSKTYMPTDGIFHELQKAKINKLNWDQLVLLNPTSTILQSFKQQNPDGFAHNVYYDRTDSITGSLKVSEGPKILSVNKTARKQLLAVSRFGNDGMIVSVDYKSLEPRILKSIATTNSINPKDLYEDLKTNIFEATKISLTRTDCKNLTLTEMYGGGIEKIKTILSSHELSDLSIKKLIEITKEYYGSGSLLAELVDKLKLTGTESYIENLYGRRIPINQTDNNAYKLVNYYVHSTAIDVALYGFNAIINYIKNDLQMTEEIVPIFLLHDALFFDMKREAFQYISPICKIGSIDIPGFNEKTRFFLEPDIIFKPETINHDNNKTN